MEKEFDHEVRASVAQVEEYLDGGSFPMAVEGALEQAKNKAHSEGVAQRILLVIEPDEEEKEEE